MLCEAAQIARVDSRTTSSGASRRCTAMDSRSSIVALMLSITIPTAALPNPSIGWRTVVSEGTERPAGIMSSNPMTEQSSGTLNLARAKARIEKIRDERGIDFQSHGTRERADASPARRTIGEHFRPADKRDFSMAEGIKMFHGQVAAGFVIHHHRADGARTECATNHDRGNISFLEIGDQININEEPVRDKNQPPHRARQQHFQITLEAAALIVDVGKDRQIRGLVERIFDAAKDQGAKRVRDVENHHANGAIPFGAEVTRDNLRTVGKLLGGLLDAVLGRGRNVTRQWSVIENDRHRGGRDATLQRHVAEGDGHALGLAASQEFLRSRLEIQNSFPRTGIFITCAEMRPVEALFSR